MADNINRLDKSAEAAYRYYNLTLKTQDKINDLIRKGTIKSFEDLSKAIARVAEDDLPNVKHNIVEASRELEKMSDNFDNISDNILSNRIKLQKFLADVKNYNALKQESFKLQRRALQSDILSLDQMKEALSIMGKQLRVRSRSEKISEKELSNKQFLLETLRNAGDLSPKGIQLVDDAVYGRVNKINEALLKTKANLVKNAEETDNQTQRVSSLTSEFRKFQNLTMRKGKLEKKSETLDKAKGVNPKTLSSQQKQIGSEIKKINNSLSSMTFSTYKEYVENIRKSKKQLEELPIIKSKLIERSERLNKVFSYFSTNLSSVDKKLKEQLYSYKKLYDEATSIEDKSSILVKRMQGATEVNKDQISFYKQMLGLLDAQQQATGELGDVEYRIYKRRAGFLIKADKIHDDIQDKIEKQFTMLSDISGFVPIIGDNLSQGFDNARQKVSDLASEMYQEFALTFSKTGSASKALGSAMSKALSKPGAVAALAIGAAVVAAGALYMQIRKLSLLMEEVSRETGLTADQAYVLEKSALRTQIRFDNVLSSMEDLRSAQRGVVNEAGFFLQLQNDTLNTVSNTGRAFGYGSEMAGRLQTELMQVSGGSEVLAANTQVALASIAEAEGLAPGLIPKDIVENSELVARYFTGYPGALAEATLEIHKMGLGLGQMGQMMQHLLDYEKSITAEFEASVAIGRHVNVGRARDLLLQEDVLGAMEQMRKEAGSLAEFEDMGFARRQLMANAMGISVKETRKMLFVSEKLSGESDHLKESTLQNYELIQKLTGGNESLFKVQAKNIQASQQFETAVMKIKNVFKKALLPVLESMLPILRMGANLISFLAKTLDGILAPINVVAGLLNDTSRAVGAMFGAGDGRGAFASTKEAAGQFMPSAKEDGGTIGAIAKGLGIATFAGVSVAKLMGKKTGIGKGLSGAASKLPLIGGGRGGSPSKPMFVSVVGGGGIGSLIGGGRGGSLRRGGRGPRSGRMLSKGVADRYARRYGNRAAKRRFGAAFSGSKAIGRRGLGGRIGGMLSGVGAMAASSKLGKGIGKIAGKGVGKSLMKKIPGLSILSGAAFAGQRFASGDILGGVGELASGVLGTIPGLGTAASFGIDTLLMGRDMRGSKSGSKSAASGVKPRGRGIGGGLAKATPYILGGVGAGVAAISTISKNRKERPTEVRESGESGSSIEEYKKMNEQLIKAVDSVRQELTMMRQSPTPAVISDTTTRELNRKLKGFNGS